MMTCSRETLVRLFYNVSSSSFLLLLLLYFSSTLLLKLINFIGSYPIIQRPDGGFGGEEMHPVLVSAVSESENDECGYDCRRMTSDTDSFHDSVPNLHGPTAPVTEDFNKSGFMDSDENRGEDCIIQEIENNKADRNFSVDEKFLIYAPTRSESRKLRVQEKDEEEEIFGDSCTVGSTSKSSSEWRSSIKDSGTEDPFSSSSRRSCPRWESYTLFQKYDEEMMFLDRISVQKLHETESLRSIKVNPRSFSDRIVHKISTINKKPSDIRQNPYHELEGAYVAQVCLTWEALNWNYKNFERKRASQRDHDPGCPAHVAQQFQQFQVLLQRYIENEPYEQGRRPEVYARMRRLAPKLLLVPEYRDSEDDQRDDANFGSRISSAAFLMIMEDGIRTFMNFLKADKEKTCQKKIKLKDLRRGRSCIRKRKLTVEEEMEILMGLIDLKLVSRVLRMTDMSEEQLHWCEEKMSKVRLLDGKLQRDSSPLFFPAH
uniref:Ribosomal protein L34Ae n=1 Tax=Salix viminalis TaxID=40686 RepID=A0A6N2KCV2_SALVM